MDLSSAFLGKLRHLYDSLFAVLIGDEAKDAIHGSIDFLDRSQHRSFFLVLKDDSYIFNWIHYEI